MALEDVTLREVALFELFESERTALVARIERIKRVTDLAEDFCHFFRDGADAGFLANIVGNLESAIERCHMHHDLDPPADADG